MYVTFMNQVERTYRSRDIQEFGISKIQLVHWVQVGAIIPLKDARGRGGRRVYSYQNLVEALICRELAKYSIETHVMRSLLEVLREDKIGVIGRNKNVSFWDYIEQDKPNLLFMANTELIARGAGIETEIMPFLLESLTEGHQDKPFLGLVPKDGVGDLMTFFPSAIVLNPEQLRAEARLEMPGLKAVGQAREK